MKDKTKKCLKCGEVKDVNLGFYKNDKNLPINHCKKCKSTNTLNSRNTKRILIDPEYLNKKIIKKTNLKNGLKKCSICQETKEFNCFSPGKKTKSGVKLYSICKSCKNLKCKKKARLNNPNLILKDIGMHSCSLCNKILPRDEDHFIFSKGRIHKCKKCHSQYSTNHYLKSRNRLEDCYIVTLIHRETKVSRDTIKKYPELIQLKRELIKIKQL